MCMCIYIYIYMYTYICIIYTYICVDLHIYTDVAPRPATSGQARQPLLRGLAGRRPAPINNDSYYNNNSY